MKLLDRFLVALYRRLLRPHVIRLHRRLDVHAKRIRALNERFNREGKRSKGQIYTFIQDVKKNADAALVETTKIRETGIQERGDYQTFLDRVEDLDEKGVFDLQSRVAALEHQVRQLAAGADRTGATGG